MGALMDKIQSLVGAWGPLVLKAVLILVVGWLVARLLRGVLQRVMAKGKVDPTLISFSSSLVYMAVMAMVVIAALGTLGVDTGSFVAVIAAAGFAIAFALQGSLGNFAAGVMLIIFRPFKVGDFIEAGGTSGVVEVLQVFATTLKTADNKTITVPNSAITGGNITNYSVKPTRRIDLVFGIGYDDDLQKAKAVLSDILAKDDRVLDDPEPTVAVLELADSSVNFAVRPWVKTADYWPVLFDITEAVKRELDRAGISIPYPQQDVHMHQVA